MAENKGEGVKLIGMLVRKDYYRHAMQSHQLVGASNKEKALVGGAFSGHC